MHNTASVVVRLSGLIDVRRLPIVVDFDRTLEHDRVFIARMVVALGRAPRWPIRDADHHMHFIVIAQWLIGQYRNVGTGRLGGVLSDSDARAQRYGNGQKE
jgi:hypothetical protein